MVFSLKLRFIPFDYTPIGIDVIIQSPDCRDALKSGHPFLFVSFLFDFSAKCELA